MRSKALPAGRRARPGHPGGAALLRNAFLVVWEGNLDCVSSRRARPLAAWSRSILPRVEVGFTRRGALPLESMHISELLFGNWRDVIPTPWVELLSVLAAMACGVIVGGEREKKE